MFTLIWMNNRGSAIHLQEYCLLTGEAKKYGLEAIHESVPRKCVCLILLDEASKNQKLIADKFASDMEAKGVKMGNGEIKHVRLDKQGKPNFVTGYVYHDHVCGTGHDEERRGSPEPKTRGVCRGICPCITILAGISLLFLGAYLKYKTW